MHGKGLEVREGACAHGVNAVSSGDEKDVTNRGERDVREGRGEEAGGAVSSVEASGRKRAGKRGNSLGIVYRHEEVLHAPARYVPQVDMLAPVGPAVRPAEELKGLDLEHAAVHGEAVAVDREHEIGVGEVNGPNVAGDDGASGP